MKNFKLFFVSFLFSLSFFLIGCASTPKQPKLNTLKSLEGENYKIYSIPDKDENYIYLRSYNPFYKRRLSGGRILQTGINIIETKPIIINHVALGVELNDEFYGLTSYARPNFSLEECTNTKSNAYMRMCYKRKSIQTVFAMKVSAEEKEAVRKIILDCAENDLIHYDVSQNFVFAKRGIDAKFFGGSVKSSEPEEVYISKSKNDFEESEKNLEKSGRKKIALPEFHEDKKNNFVCSNFAAYVIYTNVPETQEYFDENFSDILLVGPSDIASVPGFFPVFTSTWAAYDDALEEIQKEQKQNRPNN